MNWLTRNVGIDGIYLDDVAFDRVYHEAYQKSINSGWATGNFRSAQRQPVQ